MAHTNGIESFWSMLKRSYQGIFHKTSPKPWIAYVTDSQAVTARLPVRDIMVGMVVGMVGKRLCYRELLVA